MAVMSAGLNALTTATTVDFYKRLLYPNSSDTNTVLVGRIGTVIWGLLATVGALFARRLGPILNAFNIINSFLGGLILGIFLLGMLSRRARGTGVICGAVLGLCSVSLVAWKTHVSFFYYAIVGTVVTFVCGWLLSVLHSAVEPPKIIGSIRESES
jgi:Na+/proline symporter